LWEINDFQKKFCVFGSLFTSFQIWRIIDMRGEYMDKIDIKIINMLIDNSRTSVSSIAQKVNMSISAAAERIRKLEASKIIQQYTTILDEKQVGLDTMAFVSVNMEHPNNFESFAEYVQQQDAIVECYFCAGDVDYMLKLKTKTIFELQKILSDIRRVPGVSRYKTMIVLSAEKEGYTPLLDLSVVNNQ